jgi:cytochrome c553
MTPLHRLALASAGVLALAAAGLEAADAPQPVKLSWLSPPGDKAHGAQLGAVCLSCHSANAPVTDPVAPKLYHTRQSYLVSAIAAFRDGQRESAIMGPMVQGLSDQDVRDVAAYLAGDMHDKPPKSNEQDSYYGFARAHCTMCHGESGIGEMEGMPVLTGQDPAYLQAALEEYRKGIRKDPTMREVAAKLTPEDEKGMAAYFAQYPWLEKQK